MEGTYVEPRLSPPWETHSVLYLEDAQKET